ncbi:MAG TPA: FMN-binding protein [Candidatus Saccharimonadales bacterium]|nr:FMN-binding protein [Candidatus Saccharimonadales bacterium]
METNKSDKNKQIIATLVVLVVVVLIVMGTKAIGSKDDTSNTASIQSSTSSESATESSTAVSDGSEAVSFEDGTYSATGSYTSPGGSQQIEVSVTISNGRVTSTSATEKASDSQSQSFQEDFISGYKSQVVGKSLDSIDLSRVSGSSLTSQGFNDAIEQIKDQAKA